MTFDAEIEVITVFKVGDVCYFLISGASPTEGKILAKNGELYTIRYGGNKGIRLKEHRLYKTLEDSERETPKQEPMVRSPYDYPH